MCLPYTEKNLHAMARDLGIARCWWHVGARYAHYDIPTRRVAEIQARCTVVSSREILRIVKGERTV